MPITLKAGVFREIDQPGYGKLGVSCGVEVEIGGQLHAVSGAWDGRGHHRAPMCQNTDHGAIEFPTSPPQILVPVNSFVFAMARSERLANRRSVAPSPIRQAADNKPFSSTDASPKRAPESRGMTFRLRIESRCCTSVRR